MWEPLISDMGNIFLLPPVRTQRNRTGGMNKAAIIRDGIYFGSDFSLQSCKKTDCLLSELLGLWRSVLAAQGDKHSRYQMAFKSLCHSAPGNAK